ncbi:MAG: hypothetical protein MJZ66_05600 [Bacteroidales bacterium]|nr:hypothetical protein [Bacteroidales bacterium]
MANIEDDFEGFRRSKDKEPKNSNSGMFAGLLIGMAAAFLLSLFIKKGNATPQTIRIVDTVYIEKEVEVVEVMEPVPEEFLHPDAPVSNAVSEKIPSVTISLANSTLYVGYPNRLYIAASGVEPSHLNITISNGSITKGAKVGEYIANVMSPGIAKVNVAMNMDGRITSLGFKEFSVKRVPDPRAAVGKDPGNMFGGEISKATLMNQAGIWACLDDFPDMKFTAVEFTISAHVKGFLSQVKSKSAAFSAQQKNFLRDLPEGEIVVLHDIRAKGPDGTIRNLPSIVYKIK